MDDFERNLATMLRSTPAPPGHIEPAEITRRSGSRARSVAAPLVAGLVVVAVAVTLLVLRSAGSDRPRSGATPPATQQPSDLIGSWRLTDLQGLNGAAHTRPFAAQTFRFSTHRLVTQGCLSAKITIGAGTLRFVQDFTTSSPVGCPVPRLPHGAEPYLFNQILTRTATWHISDGKLRVERDGAAAVFQRVASPTTPSATTGAPSPSPSPTRYSLAGGTGEFASADANQLAELLANGGLTAAQAIRKFKAHDPAWKPPADAVHRYGFFTLEHGITGDHYLRTPTWAIVQPGCAPSHGSPHDPRPGLVHPPGCESWVLLNAYTGDLLLIANGP
jgi:hypothetical protein